MGELKTVSGEAVRLAIIREVFRYGARSIGSHVVFGVEAMDDGAVLTFNGESVVIASDFVRGSGFFLFQLGHMNYFDVGYYLIMANASDVAAMGARPIAATTIVRYADGMTDAEFAQACSGMRAAADECGIEIVGGDIGGHACDVFSATLVGVPAGAVLRRAGARVGDVLCVTGHVGRPIAALTYFKKGKPAGKVIAEEYEADLLSSWRRPRARVREGETLGRMGLATACQDVSDGLKATIDQLGAASGVSFRIYADRLPIPPSVISVAEAMEMDSIALAMSASVDFELLFTLPHRDCDIVREAMSAIGCPISVIGEAIPQHENQLVDALGATRIMPGIAWEQQTDDYLAEIVRQGKRA